VEEKEGICGNSDFVEFALGSWPIKVKYPELKNHLGKTNL